MTRYIKNRIKEVVGAGVTLGVGGVALGAMGQPGISASILPPASRMLGVATTAGMGMGVMRVVNQGAKKLNNFKPRRYY